MQKITKICIFIIFCMAFLPKHNFNLSIREIIFILLSFIWSVYVLKSVFCSDYYKVSLNNFFILSGIFILKIINMEMVISYTISEILFFMAMSSIAQIFEEKRENRTKIFWLSVLTVLFLPIKEYIQIFIGTPIRFISAEIISRIFSVFQIGEISQTAIIMTENNITDIQSSCS